MTHAPLTQSILDYPWPLRHYACWLSEHRALETDDYLYSQSRVRLVVHDDDQLVVPDTVSVGQAHQGTFVRLDRQAQKVALAGIKCEHAEAIIAALRLHPTAVELPVASGVPAESCERLLSIGFGRFVFAPQSLERLESQACAAEIVRFPGSPYELVRNYWQNVGSLNQALESSLAGSRSSSGFLDWLRTLHVHLLLGADFRTFYRPSSPLAQRRAEPGALYETPSRTLRTNLGEFLLDGPRVNASAIGGSRYHALIDRSLGMKGPASDSKEFVSSDVGWGRLVMGRARAETQLQQWFLPPRPIVDSHWDNLCHAWMRTLEAIDRRDAPAGIEYLGRFHWYFVHLHPFTCANQSLAFAIVNWAMNRLVQSGIPHLILDQLALRHDCAEYTRLFARAVGNWTAAEAEPAVRHMSRVRKKQALEAFIAQLAAATDDSDTERLFERSVDSAAAALLLDGIA